MSPAVFLLLIIVGAAYGIKKERMSLLYLIPVTGDGPRNGAACKNGAQVAFEEANARMDILPDYHIDAAFEDEGSLSAQSLRNAVQFRRKVDAISPNATNIQYQAPIVIGPYFTAGGAALARAAHHIDMIQVAIGMTAPQFTANRRIFTNLFRIKLTGDLVAYLQLKFMREYGNKWHRFGILTFSANALDIQMGLFLLKLASEEGFDISFFDAVADVDEGTIARLKDSDSRVIVVTTTTVAYILKFLCFSYKAGMTGPRYAFITHAGGYTDVPSVPNTVADAPFCTRKIILEQMQYTIWTGYATVVSGKQAETVRSTLGMSLAEFESRFNNRTVNVSLADNDKRFQCHDAALQAVVALDAAEKFLNQQRLSLRNYLDQPKLVMKVVNASMANVSYVGFRVGTFKYSKRAEFDSDTQVSFQWTPVADRQILTEVKMENDAFLYNYSNYKSRELAKPIWFTNDGLAPKDGVTTIESLAVAPDELFWVIVAISVLAFGVQIYSVGKTISNQFFGEYVDPSFPFSRILALTGCAIMNGSAIVFAFKIESRSKGYICILQRVFCAMGVALVHGYVIFKMIGFLRFKKILERFAGSAALTNKTVRIHLSTDRTRLSRNQDQRKEKASSKRASVIHVDQPVPQNMYELVPSASQSRRLSQPRLNSSNTQNSLGPGYVRSTSAVPPSASVPVPIEYDIEKPCNYGIAFFVAITAVYLAMWLSIDAPAVYFENLTPAVYNKETDKLFIVNCFLCRSASKTDAAWIIGLTAIHCLLLGIAAFLSYELRRCERMPDVFDDFKAVRMLSAILTTLIFGGVLMLIVLQSAVSQTIAVSVLSMVFSCLTTATITYSITRAPTEPSPLK